MVFIIYSSFFMGNAIYYRHCYNLIGIYYIGGKRNAGIIGSIGKEQPNQRKGSCGHAAGGGAGDCGAAEPA